MFRYEQSFGEDISRHFFYPHVLWFNPLLLVYSPDKMMSNADVLPLNRR